MQKLRKIKYNPTSYQREFHNAEKHKVYLSTGYGGGKTYSLCMKLLKLAAINKGLPGCLLAPNMKMFRRDVLPTMREIAEENGMGFKYFERDSIMYLPEIGSKIFIFHDEDKGVSIRGPNMAFGAINEASLISKEAYDAIIARVRLKKSKLLQIIMSGTPEGFNWIYEYFIENPRQDTDLIFGSSRENTHVHGSYFDMLAESYDALMQEQYIDGKFVNVKGRRALWAFDRFKHVKKGLERNEEYPIWVSLDFNINPMAATLWNVYGPESHVRLKAFDEICLNSSDTDEMAQALIAKIGHKEFTIYPDPAGAAGSTKSKGKSDIHILKTYGLEDIKYKRSIVSVRDCLNAFNNMLSKGKIEISDKCKQLIADCEQCTIGKDSINLDKSNQMRTHWIDGAKNMIEFEFPIRAKAGTWREVQLR